MARRGWLTLSKAFTETPLLGHQSVSLHAYSLVNKIINETHKLDFTGPLVSETMLESIKDGERWNDALWNLLLYAPTV